MQVRKARLEDLASISNIAKENWDTSLDYLREFDNQDTVILVAEAGQGCRTVITGYAIMKLASWNKTANLLEFAVRSDWKRGGVGKLIMQRIRKTAGESGIRAVLAETQPDNLVANRFYEAAGLRICGYNDRFYTNKPQTPKEVALFYSLDLP